MTPLSLLYIQHTTEVSGSLVSLYNIFSGLEKLKAPYQLEVLCKDPDVAHWYQERGVNARYAPSSIGFLGHCSGCTYQLSHPLELYSLLKQILLLPWYVYRQYHFIQNSPCQIVHLNSSVLLSSALAARLARRKLVWHVREVMSEGNLGLRKWALTKLIKSLAHKIVAISPFEAEKLGPDPQEKVQVIYNFLDFREFSSPTHLQSGQQLKAALGLTAQNRVIVSLGGMSLIKGTLELVDSLPYLPADVHLVVAGQLYFQDGPTPLPARQGLKGRLRNLLRTWREYKHAAYVKSIKAKSAPYSDRIHFIGTQYPVPQVFSLADIVYFGGTIPHFPRPIYEAWAMKKPVVAFNVDGIRHNVTHGQDALLVPRISGRDLSQAFHQLLSDPHLCASLGQAGFAKSQERFNIENNTWQIVRIYQELSGHL